MIEQRGWEKFCKHYKTWYASIVREFYSNLVGRKENSVFVREVWVPYGAKTINAIYGMEGHRHGSKFKKLLANPNREKIVRELTNGKVQRDSEQETKTKEHIKGFKFLYMQLLKDFEKKMMDRDKVLDDNDSYRRKIWLENLDLINNNLSKFLEVMTELEHNMNTLGMRQDELNEKWISQMNWSWKNRQKKRMPRRRGEWK